MNRVVVTGIGVVSPNGIGRNEFKNAALQGRSGIGRIRRFDPSPFSSQVAGEIELNNHFFSKKEQRNLPRVYQLAALASDEAIQDAKLETENLSTEDRQRFGVVIGSGGGSSEFMERHYEKLFRKDWRDSSLYVISASTAGGLSSELSIRHHLLGLSHVVTTGCASSTDAMGYAFREIAAGRLDTVLTGGADAPITEGIMRGFELMKILSTHWNDRPEKSSRPFNKNRDGFVLSEGAWMFVLESEQHARRRGAHIYGEICGYGSSCEAFHAVRLNDHDTGNFRATELALSEANLPHEAIDYVNLHGTSTVLNDRVESKAMCHVFGKRAERIPMSSLKSMVGHPQGASGAAGLAATLLAMTENKIHPTINYEVEDPECPLDYVPNEARQQEIEYALCHTLGFGSKCSALVVRNGK